MKKECPEITALFLVAARPAKRKESASGNFLPLAMLNTRNGENFG